MQTTKNLIKQYYDAFNQGDMEAFLNCLSDDIIHDINQGNSQKDKAEFSKFMDHMNHCYKEEITDLIIMADDHGSRASAEFIVRGIYISTDKGLPEAKQQQYKLPVGAFFAVKNNKIIRITTYYNMRDWINQVSE